MSKAYRNHQPTLKRRSQQTSCPHALRASGALAACSALSACAPTPLSTLHTSSEQAAHIVNVWQAMAWGSLVILLIMVALVLMAVRAKAIKPGRRSFWLLLGGGVLFPVSVMSVLLAYTYLWAPPQAEAQYRVRVTAQQWHWAVAYPEAEGGERHSINVIHIPQGVPTLIELHATDVIHSFWVPRLGGKMDAIPGRVNKLIYIAQEAGVYQGQCAEYCGIGHAAMRFQVIAHPPEQLSRIMTSLPMEQKAP